MPTSKPLTVPAKTADNSVFPHGFDHLRGHLDVPRQQALMRDVAVVVAAAPLYRPSMPRTGKPFSVLMTNCGTLGWVSDRDGGYRYQSAHPETGRPWPAMPASLVALWQEIARYPHPPQACLVNHYEPGTKLGSHVDADEEATEAPVLSISLGDTAVFHIGGLLRTDPKIKLELHSGDVVVLGGGARLAYHGLDRIRPGTSDIVPWGGRINLTLRRVTRPGW